MTYSLIIIGSGPAGLTAALYAARAELKPLVISGTQAGGQLMLTTDVENYPGFPTILGPDLMTKMTEHATHFGAQIVKKDVTRVDFSVRPFKIWTDNDLLQANAVVVATGASAKWLGLDSEARLRGKGVSSCATCDGFFFKDKAVAVVGGGDTALEEATFLTKFATKVTVIHRRDRLNASRPLQNRAFSNPKIEFIWHSVIKEVLGDNSVTGVKLFNNKINTERTLSVQGLFVAIGHEPNTAIFKDHLELDENGYIMAMNRTMTSVEGVFVAGDVEDHIYRQAVTAAGAGCKAAMDAEKWLSHSL